MESVLLVYDVVRPLVKLVLSLVERVVTVDIVPVSSELLVCFKLFSEYFLGFVVLSGCFGLGDDTVSGVRKLSKKDKQWKTKKVGRIL